jgi:hypothetical protein
LKPKRLIKKQEGSWMPQTPSRSLASRKKTYVMSAAVLILIFPRLVTIPAAFAKPVDMRSIPPMYDRERFEMENNEIQGDLLDEYQAIQNAEFPMEEEPEMASDEEIKQLLGELWDEVLPLQEEYTERDAFNDYIADQQEEWN